MTTRSAIILSLADPATADPAGKADDPCASTHGSDSTGGDGGCGACGLACLAGTGAASGEACSRGPRVPVLACKDALGAHGYDVELVTATSDAEIDAVIARLDGPDRLDGLTWPAGPADDAPVLVVATEADAQLRHVIRRMVRRYTPAPSKRPDDLRDGRTLPDLPPIGVLPLVPAPTVEPDLADRLGLPRDPVDVAKAVDGGAHRHVDLLRSDGSSITLHGALLGGVDAGGEAGRWSGQVIVDDTVLADGTEPLLACAVANANGYAHLDEIPLAPAADPSSGTVTVAVAVPVTVRSRFGRTSVRLEVRRATGRAVAVTPAADLPYLDDGVPGVLTRRRTWWVEPGAWSAYTL